MSDKIICIEITGEGLYHYFLCQSGFSGRDYRFFRNYKTASYIRAYQSLEEYLAERDDLHTGGSVWPLKFNLLDPADVAVECYTTKAPSPAKPTPESGKVEDPEIAEVEEVKSEPLSDPSNEPSIPPETPPSIPPAWPKQKSRKT